MKIADSGRPAEILLVEDREDDVLILCTGFQRASFPVNIHHVENGEECLNFLRKKGQYASAPTPDLVFLDLNMPVMDGRETIAEIVSDPYLRRTPVVVLTTSENERDLVNIYDLRCSSCITKPVDFQEVKEMVEVIGKYWFSFVELPPHQEG